MRNAPGAERIALKDHCHQDEAVDVGFDDESLGRSSLAAAACYGEVGKEQDDTSRQDDRHQNRERNFRPVQAHATPLQHLAKAYEEAGLQSVKSIQQLVGILTHSALTFTDS